MTQPLFGLVSPVRRRGARAQGFGRAAGTLATAVFVAAAALPTRAAVATHEDQARQLERQTAALRAPADSSDHRKYAPDREIDILHLALDLTPNFTNRTIAGRVVISFQPIGKSFRELRLDAVDLTIEEVTASDPIQGWQAEAKQLKVTFDPPIPPGRQASVTVRYRAQPQAGLYFRTRELGYKAGDDHLFTQGEAITSRNWFPCFDAPNEKFTSEVTCRVPAGMTALSNGTLAEQTKDPQTGLVAFHWVQAKPHVTYLIALAAGYFQQLEEKYRDIPLTFHTPPSEFAYAAHSFRDTADMMAFFEGEIGVPYPWAKYSQVCVNDFVAGGMENTSLTILTDGTLFPEETENIRSSQGLVAHELAHQWFGDLVTCKDWSHTWLNEGFATYYDHLYEGHKHGPDALRYSLYHSARAVLDNANDLRPIVHRAYDRPDEQFSYLAYPKGAWVLHMLRSQLGAELFRRGVQTYLERHQYGSVITDDLNAVFEELSGRSFDQFFDQWVYHGHYPELEVSYGWDEATRLARLTVRQVQALSDQVLLFKFPLTVRFKSKAGLTDRQIDVKEKEEDFHFALAEAPELVRLDPDYTLLARVKFDIPPPMLPAQLTDPSDMMGRLLAVVQLAGRKDHESVAGLKDRLQQDPFYGVRLEASKALRATHSEEAMEALLASTNQPDARVRRQVREDLRTFWRQPSLEAARQTLASEKNPDILVEAITALGTSAEPSAREALLRFLKTDSFRNVLADAAIGAMRAQDDPAYVTPLLETLQQREAAFTTGGFGSALQALARLARHEEKKNAVREFIARHVNHPKKGIQQAALAALGELGDTAAIPVLETFTRARQDSAERQAAERALVALRAAKKPADELHDLRDEVLALQKFNRELRNDLTELKKKLEELASRLGAAPSKAPAKKRK